VSEIVAIRGDTERYDLTVADALGTRVNLTGFELVFTVKVDPNDRNILIQKDTTSGIVLLDQNVQGTRGMARITLSPADTEKMLAPKTLYYDVQMTDDQQVVTTVVSGDLSLVADVTPV
jgi:hypothetical protein